MAAPATHESALGSASPACARTGAAFPVVRYWAADLDVGIFLALGMLAMERNASDPIRVFTGEDAWLIPDHAIRAVRVTNPGTKDATSIGFRLSSDGHES